MSFRWESAAQRGFHSLLTVGRAACDALLEGASGERGRETCERPRLFPDRCCGPRVLARGGQAPWGAAALPVARPQLRRGKGTGGVPPTRTAPGSAAPTLCWSSGVSTGYLRGKPFRTRATEILRDGIATQASRGQEDRRREPTGRGKPEWMCCPPSSSLPRESYFPGAPSWLLVAFPGK